MNVYVSGSHRIRCRVNPFRVKENTNNQLVTEEKGSGIGERSLRVLVVDFLWHGLEVFWTQSDTLKFNSRDCGDSRETLLCCFVDSKMLEMIISATKHPSSTNQA